MFGYLYWFRTNNGWLWTFVIKGPQGHRIAIRSGYINFIYKEQIPMYYYIKYTEYIEWLKIRGIQTFMCIVKKLNYQLHVPKDVIKMIYFYL